MQMLIDSLHDRRSGFTFVVNPAGARRDTQVSNNGTTNQDWDGVWDAKVSRDDEAWFVEYVIPFKTLRFSRDAEPGMGAQHQPADHAPQRGEQLGAGADPLQRHAAGTGRHAARSREHPAGAQPEDQAVRDRRRHAGARGAARCATTQRFRRRVRCQVQPHAVDDARRHLSHRLRAGRSRSAAGEPDALQPVLSREARLLPRELRHLHLRRRGRRRFSTNGEQPGAVLQPAHRPERGRHADSDHRRRARVRAGRPATTSACWR